MPNGTAGLELVANRAAEWSATANALKARLDAARWWVFGLSIGGALLAALATQISKFGPAFLPPEAHNWMALIAAVLLGIATFVSQRFLGANAAQRWTRARAASEALKREAFRFAAGAQPFDDPATAEAVLQAERERIEKDLDDLVGSQVPATGPGSSPRKRISASTYREDRPVFQVKKYYRPKADKYSANAKWLKTAELCLAGVATVVTAVAGSNMNTGPFDLAALTAVLTTFSGAILAHIEASRLDYLIATYRATARRLEDHDLHFAAASAAGGSEWSSFVNKCEDIIAAENNSWVAKWTAETRA